MGVSVSWIDVWMQVLPTFLTICCYHGGSAGSLEEADEQRVVLSLIERFHSLLIQGQALPSQIISSFLNAFPECNIFFQ